MLILREVKNIIDAKRDPEEETRKFQAAQEAKDYTTMFEVLFHTACQYCKKRGQGKYWTSDRLAEVATDMTIYLMQRYRRNPEYRMLSHITQIHYAFLHTVYGALQKRDKEAKITTSFEATNIDKIFIKE